MLRAQIEDDEDPIGRIRAAQALAKKADPESLRSVARALARDRFWGVAAECARALGLAGGEIAREALLAALGAAGFVDACAVVAAFHGFVRVADAIGIPHFGPANAPDLSELRERAGVNEFYRMRGEA